VKEAGMERIFPEKIYEIKNRIRDAVETERIILFGSYAYGAPRENSDYDFYVVLPDNSVKPIIALQTIYRNLGDTGMVPVDILANYKTRFEERSKLPTIERKIASDGVVLYERH
jgi:predicted nucleotidyltransferase